MNEKRGQALFHSRALKGKERGGGRVCFGVDFGSSHIKLVALRRAPKGGGLQTAGFSVTPIPLEHRRDPDQRLGFLRETLQENQKWMKVTFLAKAAVAVSGPEVTAATLLVPAGAAAQVRKSARDELSRLLTYPIGEACWTVEIPPTLEEVEGGRVSAFAIAAPRPWLKALSGVLRSFRLVPTLVTASACPIHPCLLKRGELGDSSPALLDIGFTTSTVTFSQKGRVRFLRGLPVGADHFRRGLMRTVRTPQGEHAITAQEAESILRSIGIGTGETAADSPSGLTAAQVYSMLRPTVEHLYLEVQRTLSYYRQALGKAPVDRLLVCGGGACIPHLVEFLSANMDLASAEPLNLLDPPGPAGQEGGRPPPELAPQMAVSMAVGDLELKGAAGAAAALGRSRFSLEWMQWVGVWIGCAGLAATLVWSVVLASQQIRYRGYLQKASAQVAQLEQSVALIHEYERLEASIAGRESVLQRTVSRQPLWLGVLKELSRVTPEGIRLTAVRTVPEAVPLQLAVEGEILPSYTSVEVLYSQYQLALEGSPFFSHIRLVTMEKDPYSPTPRALFHLTCQLVY